MLSANAGGQLPAAFTIEANLHGKLAALAVESNTRTMRAATATRRRRDKDGGE
jgi:hypothetical protein